MNIKHEDFFFFSHSNDKSPDPENEISLMDLNDAAAEIERSRTTSRQTFLHILKGYIGPGCLSLPWAFSQLGIRLGLIATILISILTSYNALSIMAIKRTHLDNRNTTYGDLGELAYGPTFRKVVTFFVCTQQLAIGTVYFSFIGGNLATVAIRVLRSNDDDDQDGHESSSWLSLGNRQVIMAVVFPIIMFLTCLPNLRVLAPVTAMGTILLFIGFGLIGIMISLNWESKPEEDIEVNWSAVPLALCAIMYSYEGINLILPVESAMKSPETFENIFKIAMICVAAIFSLFSIICVMAFGKVDDGSITAFLMIHYKEYFGDHWILSANFVVSFSVLFTYPLQLFPCISAVGQIRERQKRRNEMLQLNEGMNVEPEIITVPLEINNDDNDVISEQATYFSFNKILSNKAHMTSFASLPSSMHARQPNISEKSHLDGDSSLLRAILVLITFVVAVTIPNVQELISLAGALAGSSTSLIIPPLIKLRFLSDSNGNCGTNMARISCYIFIFIGVFFALSGTIASCREIYESYRK